MTNEEMIESIADEYELPVEQVALIWSVISYTCINYGESRETDWCYFKERVVEFIKEKMV